MSRKQTAEEIYNLIQEHFNFLDQEIGSNPGERAAALMAMPPEDRVLYFVHDLTCITMNAGMGAWISYHYADEGWLPDASRAFREIGHPEIADALDWLVETYRSDPVLIEDYNHTEASSRLIWKNEERIRRSLMKYLKARDFVFAES